MVLVLLRRRPQVKLDAGVAHLGRLVLQDVRDALQKSAVLLVDLLLSLYRQGNTRGSVSQLGQRDALHDLY